MKASRKGKGKGRQLAMEPPPIRLPGCDEHGNEPPLNNDKRRFLAFADTYLKKSRRVVPSAKIEGAQKLIREWQETAPDDKIISKETLVLIPPHIYQGLTNGNGVSFHPVHGRRETRRAHCIPRKEEVPVLHR